DLARAAQLGGSRPARELARIGRDIFRYPRRSQAPVLTEAGLGEDLAAEEAAEALERIADLTDRDPSLAPSAESLVDLLARMRVPRARGTDEGRVQLMSPYRARARQFEHVFVLSLQEGGFPRRRGADPFLDDAQRARAELPVRSLPAEEERYLFYVCLTRARARLYLSYRVADDDGAELTRSFFVDDVLELIEGEPEVRRKGIADTVFPADSAPSERELARALALRGDLSAPSELGVSEALASRLRTTLKAARRRAEFDPGPLTVAAVREVFAERKRFGASSLEEYATCPFRYFIQHELRPKELRPAPDPMTRGSLVHAVLERVYAELYIGRRPDAENVEQGVERARAMLAELAVEHGHQPTGARRVAAYRRIEADIVRFIRWDAANPIGERVLMLEAGFGHEGDERGPLDLGGFELHGSIDRIDVLADGRGLIRDYKNSASVSSRARIEEQRKLQLQLYTRAMEVLWGLEPAGGIYHPLANQNPTYTRPRGILAGPATELSPTLYANDGTEDEQEFAELVERGVEEARLIASQIRAGRVRRDPIGGSCPRWCDLHPICRRERGEKNPDEEPDERPSA
nr:exodeoxyribonuclease V subunit gamma [Thermoleophilaceae bacterium]